MRSCNHTNRFRTMTSSPVTKKHRHSQSRPTLFTLRMDLVGTEQTIWRRIRVDGRIRLNALHHVLQAAMGWSDAHLHEFRIEGRHYGVPNPEYDDLAWEMLDEKKYRLNQLLAAADECIYLYDFGDSWTHRITVEDVRDLADDGDAAGTAFVADGCGACPPDDAGGVNAYDEFIASQESAPYGEETQRLRKWAGLDFDPDRFDRHAANAAIARMLWNRWIKIGG